VTLRRQRGPAPTLADSAGVTTLELFFDLVFVFALTRLTSVVRDASGPADLVQAALVLCLLWWMYDGYAWMTNNVATGSTSRRVLVLLGMAAFLVAAVAVPGAFGPDGVIFGFAYLSMGLIHLGLFTQAQSQQSVRAILQVVPFNMGMAMLVVVAGWAHGALDYVLWGAAFALIVSAMARRAESGFEIRPAHFAERHGLIIIIALGESVVDLGIGAEGHLHDTATVVTTILGLALAAVLWWLYFDQDDEAGARALGASTAEGRARVALFAYSLAVLVMVAGVVVSASGLETAVAHPHRHLPAWAAWSIAAGAAIYLAGLALFRRLLSLPHPANRLLAVVPVLACAALGLTVNAATEIVVLTVVLAAAVVLDSRTHYSSSAR
jgi:low temperature requirement protein LtrA